MNDKFWIDFLPLYAVFLLSIVYTLSAIFAGMKVSGLESNSGYKKTRGQMASVVGATLALLAFVLAFTFNMAANRFDDRKQLLLSEVNAIETAYLRSGLLPQTYTIETRKLLREYVDLRVLAVTQIDKLEEAVLRSEEIQKKLWAVAEKMYAQPQVPSGGRLYIRSLNEVFDLHTKRVVVALQTRIPETIWIGLYVVAALAMATVGYQFGQTSRIPGPISLVLAMAFSSVLTLIADLDRAGGGTVMVDQRPMIQLQQKLLATP
jgi:hypothetical protein